MSIGRAGFFLGGQASYYKQRFELAPARGMRRARPQGAVRNAVKHGSEAHPAASPTRCRATSGAEGRARVFKTIEAGVASVWQLLL